MARRAASTPLNMIGAVLATCVIAAAALTFTYELTRERIIEREEEAERAALQTVLPDAEDFELDGALLGPAQEAGGDVPVQGVYRAYDSVGEIAGWGVRVAPRGYAGPVTMVVGLDRDGTVLGVSIITMTETPGLGTKIATEPGWLDQFKGWESADLKASARRFDAIAGATRSSVAVRSGVMAASEVHAQVLSAESEEVSGS